MSKILPLIDGVSLLDKDVAVTCMASSVGWYTSCSIKARYHITKAATAKYSSVSNVSLCGRHYRAIFSSTLNKAPNTLGLPSFIKYAGQELWHFGLTEQQKASLPPQWLPAGSFPEIREILEEIGGIGTGIPTDLLEGDIWLKHGLLEHWAKQGNGSGLPTDFGWYFLQCALCGQGGHLTHKPVVCVSEASAFLPIGYMHEACFQWFHANHEGLGLIFRNSCEHYVTSGLDAQLRTAPLGTPPLLPCLYCNEQIESEFGVSSHNELLCPVCVSSAHKDKRIILLPSGQLVCELCAPRVTFISAEKKAAAEVWGLEPNRILTRDIADFYVLSFLELKSPCVTAVRNELVAELADRFINYSIAACGGEYRHVATRYADPSMIPEHDFEKKFAKFVENSRFISGNRFIAWKAWKKFSDQNGVKAMQFIAKRFHTQAGSGHSIGGRRWGACADVAVAYLTKEISTTEFVDAVFGLQHNGGTFLNKMFSVSSHTTEALAIKRSCDSPESLLPYAHPGVLDLWVLLSQDHPELEAGARAIQAGRHKGLVEQRCHAFYKAVYGAGLI